MIEQFLNWYTKSDFIINPQIANSLNYVEYEGMVAILGVLAILFNAIKNAVKNQSFGVSNEWLVSAIILIFVGGSIKPLMDGIAWVSKKSDQATLLTDKDKQTMVLLATIKKKVELSNEIDSLVNHGEWNLQLAKKQVQVWVNDFKLASSLTGSSAGRAANPIGYVVTNTLEEIIGGFRALLKMYYIAMMNILYLIIPVSYVMSIFKPSHFLKPLGLYLLYGAVLTVINFIQWVIFTIFIGKTIGTDSLVDMVLSPGAMLFDLLSILLYLRAMYFARLIFPIPAEDTMGPMAGQALGMATYMVMSKMSMGGAGALKSKLDNNKGGQAQGPVSITK